MKHPPLRALLVLVLFATGLGAATATEPPDLILCHGKVWTVDTRLPVAEAVAVRGTRIVKVGSDRDVLALRGPATEVIDLHGRLVLPGFNDAHTHFENACDWFFQAQLMDVHDEAGLLARLRPAVARVPKGMWITGGDWGAFAYWAAQKKGAEKFSSFEPSLAAVDAVAPDHPVLLRRYEKNYFANSRALALAGIRQGAPDPQGGRYGRDAAGKLNGMLYGGAGEQVEKLLPPPSRAQKLIGARGVLAALNRVGLTSIHDIARLAEISQEKLYRTYIERSYTDTGIFNDLRARGELTVRVQTMLPLAAWADLAGRGIRPGGGDEFIRYGVLKDFVDGSLMFAPLNPASADTGSFTFRFESEAAMVGNITAADRAGFDVGIHVIGDKGLHSLLNWYESAIAANGPRDRRFRLIHVWYAAAADLARAGRMGLIADVTPHQLLGQDLAALERNLGPDRAKTAFAWRTMVDAGVRVSLVSDLPGLFNKTDISPFDPLENIFSAVTRRDHPGVPGPGWHPEQALTIAEAIQAYTLNPAYASREENLKGSVTEGKLADLVIVSRDILTLPPEELPTAKVDATFLGGKKVFTREPQP